MAEKRTKYRTWDNAKRYEEPVIDWPASLTDPSQNISIERLVERHVRAGSPAHNLPYGDDLSRVGWTELTVQEQAARAAFARAAAADAAALKRRADEGDAARRELQRRVVLQLKAGSPELQALASELTRILPGFEESVAPPGGGALKA